MPFSKTLFPNNEERLVAREAGEEGVLYTPAYWLLTTLCPDDTNNLKRSARRKNCTTICDVPTQFKVKANEQMHASTSKQVNEYSFNTTVIRRTTTNQQ